MAYLVPRHSERNASDVRGGTQQAEQHGNGLGKDDPKSTITGAGAIGEVHTAPDDPIWLIFGDAGTTSARVSKSWLGAHCV